VLKDLRGEREHVGRAQRHELGERPRVERHVVVHEKRAIVSRAPQSRSIAPAKPSGAST
jgi:hypothetical protein